MQTVLDIHMVLPHSIYCFAFESPLCTQWPLDALITDQFILANLVKADRLC